MSILKNSALNVLGFVIPSLIAIPAMGFMARILGVERFGLFTLVFAIIGYASIFDAGLSRAVIRLVSLHRDDHDKLSKIVGSASYAVLMLSILSALGLYLFSDKVVSLLNVSVIHRSDAVLSLNLLSFVIPPMLLSMVWFAPLDGLEQFKKANFIKIITSSIISVLPVVFVYFEDSLLFACLGLLIGRCITAIVAYVVCKRTLKVGFVTDKASFFELISFSGWITVSNIVSPIMVYFDRFILSHYMGAARVAYYSASSEVVSRMLYFSGALSRVIFPKLSGSNNEKDNKKIVLSSFMVLGFFSFFVAGGVFIFAPNILGVWMGSEYATYSTDIIRVLLIGFVFNSLAQIPFSFIQAKGHSKVTALIHLYILFPYLLLLFFLLNNSDCWGQL